MRGDRFRQCPPPPRRWDLCPIPKISDIFQRGPTRRPAPATTSPRLSPSRFSLLLSVSYRLIPGMTNSFGHWPRNTSGPARHVDSQRRGRGGFSVDGASEVRRHPRPHRGRGLSLARERASNYHLSRLSMLAKRLAYLVNEEERRRSRRLNRAYVLRGTM